MLCSFTSAVYGTSCSLAIRRTQAATVFCVATAGMLWPFFLLVLHSLVVSGAPPAVCWAFVWEVQPFTALAALADPLRKTGFEWMPGWSNWLHTILWHGGLGSLLLGSLCLDMRRLPPERFA
jgi:hypothetical protein